MPGERQWRWNLRACAAGFGAVNIRGGDAWPNKPWSSTAPPSEFRPYVDASSTLTEFSWRAVILGAIFGALFGAVSVYVGPARRADGFRVDSDRRAVDFNSSRVRQIHDSRKQHRADHRLGGRIGCGGRDLHFAGADLHGVFAEHGILARLFSRADRRMARRAVHDSAAAAAHRQGARQSAVSRGHGVRRRAGGGRARRLVRRQRVLGSGHRRRLHLADELDADVAGPAGVSARSGCPGASFRAAITSEYLGVGYIIGPKTAGTIFAGGVFSWLVLMPAIRFFGQNLTGPLYPSTIPIAQMSPDQMWSSYIRPIGAGAVAAAGLITLIRTLPTIVSALTAGLKDVRAQRAGTAAEDGPPGTRSADEVRADRIGRPAGDDLGAADVQADSRSGHRPVLESRGGGARHGFRLSCL